MVSSSICRVPVFLLLLLVFLVPAASALDRPEINCSYTAGPLMVDGNAADWSAIKARGQGIHFYRGDDQAATPARLGTTICGQITNEADCRVDLWLAHDGTYLYVLAEVKDDHYEPFFYSQNNNYAYLEDTLHLYIDSNNSRHAAISYPPIYHQSGYEQFGISTDGNIWLENTDFNNLAGPRQVAPQGAAPDGTWWVAQCGVTSLSTGYLYVFEERIALAGRPGRNMAPMMPGHSYGFDAEFCDADYGVQLQGYIWWSSDGTTDAWNHQQLWGTMNLEPVPDPVTLILFGSGALVLLLRRSRYA